MADSNDTNDPDNAEKKAGDHIFISYARVDGLELAGNLYRDLATAGHPVWGEQCIERLQ